MEDEPRESREPEVPASPIFPPETGVPAASTSGQRAGPSNAPRSAAPRRPRRRLPLILFLLTCASTFYAGVGQFAVPVTVPHPVTGEPVPQVDLDPVTRRGRVVIDWRTSLLNGFTYSVAVLCVLGAHEMGHYLQACRYRVPASLPLFIPMPLTPIGTMGAVIVQQPGVADRKSLFDIAISGPLAGLVIALPLNWWGIAHSKIEPLGAHAGGWTNPRIVEWMVAWIHRPMQAGEDIILNPILFAGWVGIFITALNLIPISQLDGSHILYCLVGRKAHLVARALYLAGWVYAIYHLWQGHTQYIGWVVMLGLLTLMGTRHPPTANDHVPIGKFRIILGWLTLAFIFVGFVSSPIYDVEPSKKPTPAIEQPQEQGAGEIL